MAEIDLPARLDREWALGDGRRLEARAAREDLILRASAVQEVDLLAAGSLYHARRLAKESGHRLALRAPSDLLVSRLAALDPGPILPIAPSAPVRPWLERLGASAWKSGNEFAKGAKFALEMVLGVASLLLHRDKSWPGATWRQLHELGTTALPVVLLLTGLIGLTLALLMGQQLAMYGASIHLATLMGVSFVREVGPLLTAVILAGRSGSAITAELASMKVLEEVDALDTMGARQASFLMAPRVLALVISMPFLALFASACGIFSGLIIAVFRLGLDPLTYFQVLSEAIEVKDIFYTILKSAVFAFVIAFLACRIGLATRGGSDAVGRATTRTVVSGIFWTVIVDCLFALVLYL
jgi:phospholipid/cholesterol/gamma-HCH transport system permease protein